MSVASFTGMTHLRAITRIALCLGAVALLAGCTGRAQYRGTATYSTTKPAGYYQADVYAQPRMAHVDDGLWVVEGRAEPVFYTSGFYWRYDGRAWYRSRYVNDNYVRVRRAPPRLRSIDRPRRYIRYQAPSRHRVRAVPRGHIRGEVRTHPRQQRRDRGDVRVRSPRDRDRIHVEPRDRRDRRDRGRRHRDRRR